MAILRLALLLAACAGAAGCFSPHTPPCAFSCAEDGLCPTGFTCADDGLCHRDDSAGTCDLTPQVDAAHDAASDDAGAANDATD
jgi:hypothetical protein